METDMTEQAQPTFKCETFEDFVAEGIKICVNDLGMKMPLNIVHMDKAGHIVAAEVHADGRIVPLVDSGRGVSAPLYPVHALIVDRDGNSATLALDLKDERMRVLH